MDKCYPMWRYATHHKGCHESVADYAQACTQNLWINLGASAQAPPGFRAAPHASFAVTAIPRQSFMSSRQRCYALRLPELFGQRPDTAYARGYFLVRRMTWAKSCRPPLSSACTVPSKSLASRFWLSLRLPSIRVSSISIPTICVSMSAR